MALQVIVRKHMIHLDDKKMEQVALGVRFTPEEHRRVAHHLRICPDCSRRVEEHREFYADVRREFEDPAVDPLPAIIRRTEKQRMGSQALENCEQYGRRFPVQRGFLGGITRSLMSHPFRSAVGGTAIVAAAALLTHYGSRLLTQAVPVYVAVDPAHMSLDVYGEKDQIIWKKPVWITQEMLDNSVDVREKQAEILDLDHDATNELVTTYILAKSGVERLSSVVRVFNDDGSLREERSLCTPVSYRGSTYDTTFSATGLATMSTRSGVSNEVFVCVKNRRSPFALFRLDHQLNVIGAYWHFGHLFGPLVLVRRDSTRVIALWGTNDEAGDRGLSRSALVILDPAKIQGTTESSATRGFGYPMSTAEVVYMRMPDPDMVASAPMLSSMIRRIESVTPTTIHVVQAFFAVHQQLGGIEYVVDYNWSVIDVRPMSGLAAAIERFSPKAAAVRRDNPEYYKALGRNVEYWDGRTWMKSGQASPLPSGKQP